MHKYRIVSQLSHLHISVYMTIFRVLTEYIRVVMCKVQYICIYNSIVYYICIVYLCISFVLFDKYKKKCTVWIM